MISNLIISLALCHNVTPSYEDGVKCLQASSPDEVALVEIAESFGLELISRNQSEIILKTPSDTKETY